MLTRIQSHSEVCYGDVVEISLPVSGDLGKLIYRRHLTTQRMVPCTSLTNMSCMRCFCSCIWGNPDPGPVRLRDVQQVILDTNKMGKLMYRVT